MGGQGQETQSASPHLRSQLLVALVSEQQHSSHSNLLTVEHVGRVRILSLMVCRVRLLLLVVCCVRLLVFVVRHMRFLLLMDGYLWRVFGLPLVGVGEPMFDEVALVSEQLLALLTLKPLHPRVY